jgi:hypothetical protein
MKKWAGLGEVSPEEDSKVLVSLTQIGTVRQLAPTTCKPGKSLQIL